jgi:hypothetical protein
VGVRRTIALVLVLAAAAGARAAAAGAYGWPVQPFFQPHALIGVFGDPRTIFDEPWSADGVDGPGKFSFHNGVDVAAPAATPVFPVVSGRAFLISGSAVGVKAANARVFQYYHVEPAVYPGQWVVARHTVLGYVLKWALHVHFGEIDHGRITNPLVPGHLGPYADTTRPAVDSIELRDSGGHPVDPGAVQGSVDLVASAYDTPSLVAPGATPLPIAPAAMSWSLSTLSGELVAPFETTVDFRQTLPSNRDFWHVYARGTYQNVPTFGGRVLRRTGRYLFHLAREPLDTRLLPNGTYVLRVTATDARGNSGELTRQFTVANSGA